jgi:signal peptidase I
VTCVELADVDPKRLPGRAVGLVGLFVAVVAGCLMAIVAGSWVAGYDLRVVSSGSMAPAVRTGDVVVFSDDAKGVHERGQRLATGSIVVIDDSDGRTVTHRIVEALPDGSYRTRGDANPVADSTPVAPEDVAGRVHIVVPFVGWPAVWLARGGQQPVVVAATVSIALAARRIGRARGTRRTRVRRNTPAPGNASAGLRRGRSGAPIFPTATLGGAAMLVLALVGVALAAFTDETGNGPGALAASSSFCSAPGTTTVNPVADSWVDENSDTTNFGTDTILKVRSQAAANGMAALVRFALPTVPPGCSVTTATLRMYAASSAPARTIQVHNAAAAWAEGSITWQNRPAITGTPATTTSGLGWQQWTVTGLVADQYLGSSHGLVLSDAASGGLGEEQQYQARDHANPPQLLVTFA